MESEVLQHQESIPSDVDDDGGDSDGDDMARWRAALESGEFPALGSRRNRALAATSPDSPRDSPCVRRRYVGLYMPKYQRELTIRRILAEKHTGEAITLLKQKLSMMFMMTIDCRDMIQRRKQRAKFHQSKMRALPVYFLATVPCMLVFGICISSGVLWQLFWR